MSVSPARRAEILRRLDELGAEARRTTAETRAQMAAPNMGRPKRTFSDWLHRRNTSEDFQAQADARMFKAMANLRESEALIAELNGGSS